MLSAEDNELLTRTGPGTAMGDFFRRFWMPVLLSQELPERDGPPVRERFGDPIGRTPSLRAD
jgi:phthalate 4,5-dioxygenase oxygenase subunit